jgi:hypothetical protein
MEKLKKSPCASLLCAALLFLTKEKKAAKTKPYLYSSTP